MNCLKCGNPNAYDSTGLCGKCNAGSWASVITKDLVESSPCCCVGPQNREPLCPCKMRGVIKRNGRYIQPEVDLGPIMDGVRL